MASNPVPHDRTKHITITKFFIREANEISMEHVDTLLNVADIGVKALESVKLDPLRDIAWLI